MLVSLTEKGRKAFLHHQQFHEKLVNAIVEQLSEEERLVLEKALMRINQFFFSRR